MSSESEPKGNHMPSCLIGTRPRDLHDVGGDMVMVVRRLINDGRPPL